MKKINAFISVDLEHDGELYGELRALSEAPGSGFAVSGCSEHFTATDEWTERARRRIRRADQVIVICGEHTDESMGVVAELRIAQEEHTPYFLLWGRRDRMCTKPTGAKTSEGMYSWTSEFIEEQVALISRTAYSEVMARTMKRFGRQHRSSGSVPVP